MSRHIYPANGHTHVLGLDAPLRRFFGQVHSANGPVLLGDGEGYEATSAGLASLLHDASSYEALLPTVVDGLERDLSDLESGDLSYEKTHSHADS